MKNWEQVKQIYIKNHRAKTLKQPERRLRDLDNIEKVFLEKFPEILKDPLLFQKFTKDEFLKKYEKGRPLNSAEKSVINGLYKSAK